MMSVAFVARAPQILSVNNRLLHKLLVNKHFHYCLDYCTLRHRHVHGLSQTFLPQFVDSKAFAQSGYQNTAAKWRRSAVAASKVCEENRNLAILTNLSMYTEPRNLGAEQWLAF